jgi:hypothetical protein
MAATDPLPEVVPSTIDPDCDCVLVDADVAASPPPAATVDEAQPLCPPGYVPRRRRRADYELRGREVVSDHAPEENPEPPPGR